MGTIRVEFVPVQKFGLGLLGLDHIQLVYEDETDAIGSQDRHCVANAPRESWNDPSMLATITEWQNSTRTQLVAF